MQHNDKFVYRLLNEMEMPEHGLRAKNPSACVSIQEHVEKGSWGRPSQFISTAASLHAVKQFATRSVSPRKRIVKIDLRKVEESSEAAVFDLTSKENRENYLTSEKAQNFARKFQEVLIRGYVPADCIEVISEEQVFRE
ncbi:hypothetical protein FSP39_017484 [Pinctada imbricata]|uniref:DUF7587 domain-containing protein n=1 Tax=Pinctada imbricata TaxID=66713 RepID=A0AA88YSN9_PINIB|nr:hypothetical protein FSP39_015534 [Pinctada imbricata]KAK3106232.1 hypothetical protein FSP39_015734 [Pinctada imbricata]KAK3106311.1 hypothetical protein FSP39_017484 [Pinctada imbricata]